MYCSTRPGGDGHVADRDFYAELSLATIGPMSGASQKVGRSLVRSAILIFIAILAFAAIPAELCGKMGDGVR